MSAQTSFRFLKDNNLTESSKEESWWKGKCLYFTILFTATTDTFSVKLSTWNPNYLKFVPFTDSCSHLIIFDTQRCNGIYFGQIYCIANIVLVNCLVASVQFNWKKNLPRKPHQVQQSVTWYEMKKIWKLSYWNEVADRLI